MSADNYFTTDQNAVFLKFHCYQSINYIHKYLFSSVHEYAGEKGYVNEQTEI
jgi:hypothetical protein